MHSASIAGLETTHFEKAPVGEVDAEDEDLQRVRQKSNALFRDIIPFLQLRLLNYRAMLDCKDRDASRQYTITRREPGPAIDAPKDNLLRILVKSTGASPRPQLPKLARVVLVCPRI